MAAATGFKNPGNPVSSHENASKNTNFHAISTHNHTKLSPNINQVIREELHLIHFQQHQKPATKNHQFQQALTRAKIPNQELA